MKSNNPLKEVGTLLVMALLSVVGALIIQGMNTGILLSGFPPEMNQVVKAVVVLCVLIVQSQRFISLIKGVRNRDKT